MSNETYPISGTNNQIIVISDLSQTSIQEILPHINIKIEGNNNTISLFESSIKQFNIALNVYIRGNNNRIEFADKVRGRWAITEYDDDNVLTVGENTDAGDFSISLHGNICHIGKNCMISAGEELWTDGHSVIDARTHKILNLPKNKIIIGDHVWLGRRCTLTKNAQIPDGCIVGIASVVTKKFNEPNCVIAGNPAKIVKRNVEWSGLRPSVYYQKQLTGEIQILKGKKL